jgi:hypothetical protein
MNTERKELYVQPALVQHELLRDITAGGSGQCRDFNFSGWFNWFLSHR